VNLTHRLIEKKNVRFFEIVLKAGWQFMKEILLFLFSATRKIGESFIEDFLIEPLTFEQKKDQFF
jgi:hypothetical protein